MLLSRRAHIRCDNRDTEKTCRNAKAGRKHDGGYLLILSSPVTFNARPQRSIVLVIAALRRSFER